VLFLKGAIWHIIIIIIIIIIVWLVFEWTLLFPRATSMQKAHSWQTLQLRCSRYLARQTLASWVAENQIIAWNRPWGTPTRQLSDQFAYLRMYWTDLHEIFRISRVCVETINLTLVFQLL